MYLYKDHMLSGTTLDAWTRRQPNKVLKRRSTHNVLILYRNSASRRAPQANSVMRAFGCGVPCAALASGTSNAIGSAAATSVAVRGRKDSDRNDRSSRDD